MTEKQVKKDDVNTVVKPSSGENDTEEKPRLKDPKRNLFHDPLPKWLVLPLDAKLPLVPGPQNLQLHTTKLGEKIIQSYPELDFDLWDPNAHETPTSYDALHDPHLHKLFESRHFREHLLKGGFINEDGEVLCSLKEFNNYRAYLHKLYLQLEKKEREEGLGSRQSNHSRCGCHEKPTHRAHSARKQHFHKIRAKIQKRRQLEKMAAEVGVSIMDINSHVKMADRDRMKISKDRSERIYQVLERVKKKQKMDRARIQKRLADEDAKRTRLRKEKERLLAERERLHQEQFQMRISDMKDRQFMERQKKLERIKQHLAECDVRSEALALDKQVKLQHRQEMMKQLWETRKCYQMNKIVVNQIKEAQEKKERKNRVEQRRKFVQQQQQKHENMLKQSAENARLKRTQYEEELKRKLRERQAEAYTALQKRSGYQIKEKRDKGDGPVPDSASPQSNFDITESLLNFMKTMDEEEELMEPFPNAEIDYTKRVQGVGPETVRIYSSLPVRNLLPSDWTPRGTPRDGWWNNYGQGIPKYELVTSTFDAELATKIPESVEEAAEKCIQMITFLASKVVYPAILRAESDLARKVEMEKRRKQKEEYERRENERRRREEERKLRAKLIEEKKIERLKRLKEEEERIKAQEMKKYSVQKRITPRKVPKPILLEKQKKDVKKNIKNLKLKKRRSSVKFNLAGNVDIPLTSPYIYVEPSPVDDDTPESELLHLHESDDSDDSEDTDGPKVEANDSLTLLRRSRIHMTPELQPTKFSSLLATEILTTLEDILVKSDETISSKKEDVTITSAESSEHKSVNEKKSSDLDDVHITPLAKILVEQAVAAVAKKLGININIGKRASLSSQHHIPIKKSSGNIKALKDIDSKTPATVLTLSVLEAAAKQTGTSLNQLIHAESQDKSSGRKISKTRKSLERAEDAYGSSSKVKARKSSDGKVGAIKHTVTSKEKSLSKSKRGPQAVSKPSKDIKSKQEIPATPGSASLSETCNVGKEIPDSIARLSTDRSISSPHLIGSQATTPQVQEQGKIKENQVEVTEDVRLELQKQDTAAKDLGQQITEVKDELTKGSGQTIQDIQEQDKETKESGQPTQELQEGQQDKTDIPTSLLQETDEEKMQKDELVEGDEGVPKKKSSFFSRVSSFLLAKRGSSKSEKSSKSEGEDKQPETDVGDNVVSQEKQDDNQKRSITPLNMSKSDQDEVETVKPSKNISSPEVAHPSVTEKENNVSRTTTTSSSQLINQLVRDEVSRILYKARVAYVGEMEVEIQHKGRKVTSNTRAIEGIVHEQLSKILLGEKAKSNEALQTDPKAVEEIVQKQTSKNLLGEKAKSSEIMQTDPKAVEEIVQKQSSKILLGEKAKSREALQTDAKAVEEIVQKQSSKNLPEEKAKSSEIMQTDPKAVEETAQEQSSKIPLGEKAKSGETMPTDVEALSDTKIIEIVVNEQIQKVLLTNNMKSGVSKSKGISDGSEGVVLKQSTPAFAAIANAYASEMNVNVCDLKSQPSEAKGNKFPTEEVPTQHPIHLAILKKIASKIEKEEEIRNRKGLEEYRKSMASMLKLDFENKMTTDFLESVAERYKYSLRKDAKKCRELTDVEDVLKNNLLTAINLIREGIMPNPQLLDLIGAVVASYLIAHTMLPLAEDVSSEHSSFAQYKGMEVGTWLSTPVLIDTLIAEILDNVKQHLRVGTFNAVHVIMAVYGMHKNSLEIVEKKEAKELSRSQTETSDTSEEEEELIAVNEVGQEVREDVEFVPMYGDHPLGLGKEEASSALVALSVKDPSEILSGTDAVERNSFVSLIRPDVSKLKTFTDADQNVTEEAARRHLSAVSMQFKKRSEAKFSPTAQAAMKGSINYEKLRRGSMPVMGLKKDIEEETDDSDEDDRTEKENLRRKLRSQSMAIGMGINTVSKITDPLLQAAGKRIQPKSVNRQWATESDESVGKEAEETEHLVSSTNSKSSGEISNLQAVQGYQSLSSDGEAEVPPEDPELLRLSARREKRAQERVAEKQKQFGRDSKEELPQKKESSVPSTKSSLHSSVTSPRASYCSVGSGLRPRPSSAFKSEKIASHQEIEQQKQVAVQTSDFGTLYQVHDPSVYEIGVQVTGNEAAVQTSSSIRQHGFRGSTQAIGSQTLELFTPLATSENWEYEYVIGSGSPDAVETTSAGALEATKEASRDSMTSRKTHSEDGGAQHSYPKHRPSSGPATKVEDAPVASKTLPNTRHPSHGKIVQTETTVPQEAIKVLIQSQQHLVRSTPNTMPQVQSAGSIQQKKIPNKERKSSVTREKEIVEYEEITEISEISPKPPSKRRMSFIPNFTAPVPVIGAYGQENRRMSFFPGFEKKEDLTRSALEQAMDPELPISQTNRDNFIMDEDDEVQEVSPLVSMTSNTTRESDASDATKPSIKKSRTSGSPNSKRGSSNLSGNNISHRRSTNMSNNNPSFPKSSVNNTSNNSSSFSHHESEKKIPSSVPEVASPYRTGTTQLRRLRMGSTTLTTKLKPKGSNT